MSNIQYPSRYQYSETVSDDADRQLLEDGIGTRFRFQDRPDNLQVTVRQGERLWHIAHRLYPQNPRAGELYWLIAAYNDIQDPTLAIEPGRVLYAPSIRVISEELLGFDS